MNALILDDSRAMRIILSRIMAGLGFSVMEAENGKQGLEHLSAQDDVTVALVDWNMPEMNGLEFIEAVRQDDRHSSMKLVMVSSETGTSHMARALMAGVDEFVMKPFTEEDLVDKLRLIGVSIPNPTE